MADGGKTAVTDGQGRLLAIVIDAEMKVERTTFVTDDSLTQQVGFIVYRRDTEVPRHYHHPIARNIVGTPEVIIVRSGRCTLDLYDDQQQLVSSHALASGAVVVLVSGGHGFRMLEDTVLLEVKQGPYTGLVEKQRF